MIGFLHPESHFIDPKALEFRRAIYQRLFMHFQFSNELSDRMFSDVGHAIPEFGVNIYLGASGKINFTSISNLYLPSAVDDWHVLTKTPSLDGTTNIRI